MADIHVICIRFVYKLCPLVYKLCPFVVMVSNSKRLLTAVDSDTIHELACLHHVSPFHAVSYALQIDISVFCCAPEQCLF